MRTNPVFTGFDEFASAGDKTEPSSALKASGFLPLEMLPAQIFNWLLNRASKGVVETETYVDNINKELNGLLTAASLSPDNSTTQVLAALYALVRDTKANGTADLDNISVTGAYQFSASTTNAPSTSAGLLLHIQWPSTTAAIQLAFGVVTPHSWIRGQTGGVWGSWNKLWQAANDGTGSGLDADTVDGKHADDIVPFIAKTFYELIGDFSSFSLNQSVLATDVGAFFRVTNNGLLNNLNKPMPNDGAGYALGGTTGSNVTTISRLLYDPETMSNISAVLGTAKRASAGVSDSLAGFVAGGYTTTETNAVEKLLFLTEARTTLSAVLALAVYNPAGVNSAFSGYVAGGMRTGGPISGIERLSFSSEVISTLSATLSGTIRYASGSNSGLKGYVFGGENPSLTAGIDVLTFSTETRGTLSATLTAATKDTESVSSPLKAYVTGGSANSTRIDRLTFSTETVLVHSSSLTAARTLPGAGLSSVIKGFIAGGNTALTVIDKIVYSSEAVSAISATLSAGRYYVAGVTNSSY